MNVIDDQCTICTLSFPCNSLDYLQNILNVFYKKSKLKNGRKCKGAFKKHDDDVTSSGPILPNISEIVRK